MDRLDSATIGPGGAEVALRWTDGRSTRFHALWLRENSPDPTTRSPVNGQRLIPSGDIDTATRVDAVDIRDGGGVLTVGFAPDGPTAEFSAAWLAAHCYDRHHPSEWGWMAAAVQRWDGRTLQSPPAASYGQLCANRPALIRWLAAIDRFGFAIAHDVPVTSGAVCDVAELFGFVRETNYGRWFDVRAQVSPDNLAYTNLGLQAHTDNPYRDPVPTLQLLHCLENTVTGGESSVVDGFTAVARLHAEDPAAALLLARHPARFEYRGTGGVWLDAKRPVIELGPDGELLAIRFNNRSAAPWVDVPFDEMTAVMAAHHRLAEIVDDPELQMRFTLRPGDLFIVDNRRVLHSRSAFTSEGSRWMQGCYADIDGLRSALRVGRGPALAEMVGDVFARRGAEEYLGEDVTMAEHMLQCAAMAERAGADDELVTAALLHDIGHFTGELGTYSPSTIVDHRHEIHGADALDGLVPRRVVDCVRLHVAAKRYLCAVEPGYFAQLSAASVHTLTLQGGPMSTTEVARFEAEPHHIDAVRVRRWDEAAKDPTAVAPPLAHFLAMLERVAARFHG